MVFGSELTDYQTFKSMDYQAELRNLKPDHEFLIGIDSDGCVFDSMEVKQKEFFIPNALKYFNLFPVSKILRETWEFVNLYSVHRGGNRFPCHYQSIRTSCRKKRDKGDGILNCPILLRLRNGLRWRQNSVMQPSENTIMKILIKGLKLF